MYAIRSYYVYARKSPVVVAAKLQVLAVVCCRLTARIVPCAVVVVLLDEPLSAVALDGSVILPHQLLVVVRDDLFGIVTHERAGETALVVSVVIEDEAFCLSRFEHCRSVAQLQGDEEVRTVRMGCRITSYNVCYTKLLRSLQV